VGLLRPYGTGCDRLGCGKKPRRQVTVPVVC
jgi:hypothetical protein